MISQKNIQLARKIGLAMRKARIAKEETLANLSSILIMSFIELRAIEEGNLYHFKGDIKILREKANDLSKQLGFDIEEFINSKNTMSNIPDFLKKAE